MARRDAYAVGDRVDGLYDGNSDDVWYPGAITALHDDDGTYDVLYDDGESEQRVVLEYLRVHQRGTICVGTRVFGRYAGGDEWYPGKIQEVLDDGTFTVEYDDGEVEPSVEMERIRESMSGDAEEREGGAEEAAPATEEQDARAEKEPEATHDVEAAETNAVDVEDVEKEDSPAVVAEREAKSDSALVVAKADEEPPAWMARTQPSEREEMPAVAPTDRDEPVEGRPRSPVPPVQEAEPPNAPAQHQPPQDAQAVDEYAGILGTVQQLETNSIDPIATKTLLSTLVKQMRAFPQATAELVHARRGEEMLIDILKRHHSHAVIQCYGFVLLRRLCFLCGKSTHFFLRHGIVDLVMIAMRKFAEDAILQASACGALAVFTRVHAGLSALLENRVSHLVLATIIFHKTYSVHTRQVHYYACEVLLELCELGDKTTIEALCGDAISGPVLSDLSPVSLLLFLLRQALSFDDKKACCAIGTLLMCLASCHRHAAQMVLDLNGLSELSTVMAKYPTEPGIQKYAASASKEVAMCSMEQHHSPTMRAQQQKKLHGKHTAYDLIDESNSMEELHHQRALQQRKQLGVRSKAKNGNGTKRKAPATDRYGVSSLNGFTSPAHHQHVGGIAATSRDGISFSKYASPIGHAPHLPPNIRPIGGPIAPSPSASNQQPSSYGQISRNHASPLVILDSQGNTPAQDKKRFVKEERQNLLFETYGVDAKTALQHGDERTQGIKRRQLKTHIVSAAANAAPDANSWASPVKTTMLIREDKPLSSRYRKLDSKTSEARKVRISGGGLGTNVGGLADDFETEEQSPATLRKQEEVARGSALVKRKSDGESKTPRSASFQLKLDNGSSTAGGMQSPIVVTPNRSKNATGSSRAKVSGRAARTNKPVARVDSSNMHLDVPKESLNSYAAQLFKEEMEAPIRQNHAAEERERLSFAEKLHKMIDKAKSSLAHSSNVSLAAETELSKSPVKANRPERDTASTRKKPMGSASATSRVVPTSTSIPMPVESVTSKKPKSVVTSRMTPAKSSTPNAAATTTPPAKTVSTVSPSLYTPAPPKNFKPDSSSQPRPPVTATSTTNAKAKPTAASRTSSTAKPATVAAEKKTSNVPTAPSDAPAAETLSQPPAASVESSPATPENGTELSVKPTETPSVCVEPVADSGSDAVSSSQDQLSDAGAVRKEAATEEAPVEHQDDLSASIVQSDLAIDTEPVAENVAGTLEDPDNSSKDADVSTPDLPTVDGHTPKVDEPTVTPEETVVAAAVAVVSAADDLYADEYNDFDDDADGGDNEPPTQDDDGMMMMVDTSALLGRDVSFEALMNLTAQVTARDGDSETPEIPAEVAVNEQTSALVTDDNAVGKMSSDAKESPDQEPPAVDKRRDIGDGENRISHDPEQLQPPEECSEEKPASDVVDTTDDKMAGDAVPDSDVSFGYSSEPADSESEPRVDESVEDATLSPLPTLDSATEAYGATEVASEDDARKEVDISVPKEATGSIEAVFAEDNLAIDSTLQETSASSEPTSAVEIDTSSPGNSTTAETEPDTRGVIPHVSERAESRQTVVSYADEDFEDTPDDVGVGETPIASENVAIAADEPQWSVAGLSVPADETAPSHTTSDEHLQAEDAEDGNLGSETPTDDPIEVAPTMEPTDTADAETSRKDEYSYGDDDFNDEAESLQSEPSVGAIETTEGGDDAVARGAVSEDSGAVSHEEAELNPLEGSDDATVVAPGATEEDNGGDDIVPPELPEGATVPHEPSQSELPTEPNKLLTSDDSSVLEEPFIPDDSMLPDESKVSEETTEQAVQSQQEESVVTEEVASAENVEGPAPGPDEPGAQPEADNSEIQSADFMEPRSATEGIVQETIEFSPTDSEVPGTNNGKSMNDDTSVESKQGEETAPDEGEALPVADVDNHERAATPDAYGDADFDEVETSEDANEAEVAQLANTVADEHVNDEEVPELNCREAETTTFPTDGSALQLGERPSTPHLYKEDMSFAEDAALLAAANRELLGTVSDASHRHEMTPDAITDDPTASVDVNSSSPAGEEESVNEPIAESPAPVNDEEPNEDSLTVEKRGEDTSSIDAAVEVETGGIDSVEQIENEQTHESVEPAPVASEDVAVMNTEGSKHAADETLSDLPSTSEEPSEPIEPAGPLLQEAETRASTPDVYADEDFDEEAVANNQQLEDQQSAAPASEAIEGSNGPAQLVSLPEDATESVPADEDQIESDELPGNSVRATTPDTYEDDGEFENDAMTSRSMDKSNATESEVENNRTTGLEDPPMDEMESDDTAKTETRSDPHPDPTQTEEADPNSGSVPAMEIITEAEGRPEIPEEATYEDDTVVETDHQDGQHENEAQPEETDISVEVESPEIASSDTLNQVPAATPEELGDYDTEVCEETKKMEHDENVERAESPVAASSVRDEITAPSKSDGGEETTKEDTAPVASLNTDNGQARGDTIEATSEVELIEHHRESGDDPDDVIQGREDQTATEDGIETLAATEGASTVNAVSDSTVESVETRAEASVVEDEVKLEPEPHQAASADLEPRDDSGESELAGKGDSVAISEQEIIPDAPVDDVKMKAEIDQHEGVSITSDKDQTLVLTEEVVPTESKMTESEAQEQVPAPAENTLEESDAQEQVPEPTEHPLEKEAIAESETVQVPPIAQESGSLDGYEVGDFDEPTGDKNEPPDEVVSPAVTAAAEISCEAQEPAEVLELESGESLQEETLKSDAGAQEASAYAVAGQSEPNGVDEERPIDQSQNPVAEGAPDAFENEAPATESTPTMSAQSDTTRDVAEISNEPAHADQESTEVFKPVPSDPVPEPSDAPSISEQGETAVVETSIEQAAAYVPVSEDTNDIAAGVIESEGDSNAALEPAIVDPARDTTPDIVSEVEAPQPEPSTTNDPPDDYAFEEEDQASPSATEAVAEATSTPVVVNASAEPNVPVGATPPESRSDDEVQYEEEENEFEETTPRSVEDAPSVGGETEPAAPPAEAPPSTDEVEYDDFETDESPPSEEVAVAPLAIKKEENTQEKQEKKLENGGEETEYAEDNDEYNDFEEEAPKPAGQEQPTRDEAQEAGAYGLEEDAFEDDEEKMPPRIEQPPPTATAAAGDVDDMNDNEYDAEYDEFED